MANITAASILYSTPLRWPAGDLVFTATKIEVASSATEYVEGGIELKPASLGLTDEAISGASSAAREATVGGMATTTALPGLIWTSGLLVEAKTDNEAQTEIKKALPCQVTLVKGVPYLRCFTQTTAGQDKYLEEVKVKLSLSLMSTTIYALGK